MTKSMCDVQGCAEDATVEVGGQLRLNPGDEAPKWIDVEFRLCPGHEAIHDKFYGDVPYLPPGDAS